MSKRRRRVLAGALAAISIFVLLGGTLARPRWDRAELGGARAAPIEALPNGAARAVTFNAFKLAQPHRVPGVLEAIEEAAARLARGARRPELIAVQEIESRPAAARLRASLSDSHRVAVCECAIEDGGSLRSAVLLAASRSTFGWRSHRCVALGREWPDHPRCAVVAELTLDERPLRAVAVHLAWHVDNAPMARRLRARANVDARTIVLGDLNTWESSRSHAVLTSPPLRDPYPNAPATHAIGARLDYVLLGRELRAIRGLGPHRRALFDRLAPTDAQWLPASCDREGPPACPRSDHLPEGALIGWR